MNGLVARRTTTRERAAYHEAGHVVGWLAAPFEPPDIYAVTIERDRTRHMTGEVRHRLPPDGDGQDFDGWQHRLSIGRALARGRLHALASALARVSAQIRAHAAGPVAEALLIRARVDTIAEGECDFWNAYELAASAGLEPTLLWRAETRRARRWLRRRWTDVEHFARLLLRQQGGRRRLAGAALKSSIAAMRVRSTSPYTATRYEASARRLLEHHRERWRGRSHWIVLDTTERRGTAVAWADDRGTARAIAHELAAHAHDPHFEVQRRHARSPRSRTQRSKIVST